MIGLHNVAAFSLSKPTIGSCMASLCSGVRCRWPCVVPKCTASSVSHNEVCNRSPDLVEMEYADLRLKPLYAASDVGHVRIRQHVNPLSSSFAVPVQPPDWKEIFTDSTLPLMVDIGCGSGRFLIWHAKNSPLHRNYLGLEIRQKLVKRSQFWANELGLQNIYFMFANVNVSFEQLVSSYPGPLAFVSILVLIQSDVHEVAVDMRDAFDAYTEVFEHVDRIDPSFSCNSEGWLQHNPMGIRTEREIHAELEGATIYRRMYQKTREVLKFSQHQPSDCLEIRAGTDLKTIKRLML